MSRATTAGGGKGTGASFGAFRVGQCLGECCKSRRQHRPGARRPWGTRGAGTVDAAKGDWAAIQQESLAITRGLAALMERSPADAEVQEWIRRHHRQINDRFYTCPPEMYRGLGTMYVEDPRFAANYERVKPGLARFVQAAIAAYCDQLGGQ